MGLALYYSMNAVKTNKTRGNDERHYQSSTNYNQEETMSKHTAGPWKTGEDTASHRAEWAKIIGGNGAQVAKITSLNKRGNRQRGDFEEEQANSKLIAAAPDLLEALQDAVRIIEAESEACGIYKAYKEKLRAAIAKATT